jgi:hypothetical protein
MDTPVQLTPEEETAIKSLQVKLRGLRFYQILNIDILSDTMRENLWETKKLIACGQDGWFFTAEGRIVREILFKED